MLKPFSSADGSVWLITAAVIANTIDSKITFFQFFHRKYRNYFSVQNGGILLSPCNVQLKQKGFAKYN